MRSPALYTPAPPVFRRFLVSPLSSHLHLSSARLNFPTSRLHLPALPAIAASQCLPPVSCSPAHRVCFRRIQVSCDWQQKPTAGAGRGPVCVLACECLMCLCHVEMCLCKDEVCLRVLCGFAQFPLACALFLGPFCRHHAQFGTDAQCPGAAVPALAQRYCRYL